MKNKPTKRWEILKIEGDKIKRTKRTCPRCGEGVYMAEHEDRFFCGKCRFTEWKKSA